MKSRYIASVLVCVAGLLQAAETSKLNIPDPVAVVEGKEIKRADVDGPLNALIAKSGKKPEEITDAEKMAGARMIVNTLGLHARQRRRSQRPLPKSGQPVPRRPTVRRPAPAGRIDPGDPQRED